MRRTVNLLLALVALTLGATAQNHLGIFRDNSSTFISSFDSITVENINTRPLTFEAENSWFLYHPENTTYYKTSSFTGTRKTLSKYADQVSGGEFLYVDSYNGNNPTITYRLGGRRYSGRYDIHIILVPDYYAEECGDTINDTIMHTFKVQVGYGYATNTTAKHLVSKAVTFTYDGRFVEDIVAVEDFLFPTYSYNAESKAFWQYPYDSEDYLQIIGACTSTLSKRGYRYNLCIDRIYLVPKEPVGDEIPGMVVYDKNGSLALDKNEIQSIQMAQINFDNVEAKVNPKDYTDVEISASISGMKELWDAGLQASYGIELVSLSTVDAYGQTYTTTDMGAQYKQPWSYDITDKFCNIAPYSNMQFSEEDISAKTSDGVSMIKSMPALLPNATVGFKAYVEVNGTRFYSQCKEFHTPAFKASLLKIGTPIQEKGTCDLACTFDASVLMASMNKVTIPNPYTQRYTFVDQRNYLYFASQTTGKGMEFPNVEELPDVEKSISRISEQMTFVDPFSYDCDTPSQTMKYRMLVFLPDFSLDSWSGSSMYYNSYTSTRESNFMDFLNERRSHTICYAVEFDNGGSPQPYATFRFENPVEAELAGHDKTLLQELVEDGSFTTYVRLMNDKEVNLGQYLSDKSARVTAFASDDKAWERFFQKNAKLPAGDYWSNATSYGALTREQKNQLARYSLLTYLHQADELTSNPKDNAKKGESIRRTNLLQPTNQVERVSADDVPFNYSAVQKDYWERFRKENGGNGLLLATDSTVALTFVMDRACMNKYGITDQDYRIIYGQEPKAGDILVGESVLKEADGTTANGFLNVVSDVITPRKSMAEVIRSNGKTNIFSHIMDRFSAPFYSQEMTEQYAGSDSVFVKRYFSGQSAGNTRLDYEPGPNGTTQAYNPYKNGGYYTPSLKFDPAWNSYYSDYSPEQEMAAMFVPSDKAMWEFFTKGSGMQFIRTYYLMEGTTEEKAYVAPTTVDELYQQIDAIPMEVLSTFVNTIMMRSFTASVPSKMTTLVDDALEQIFFYEDREKIDACLPASNGAVYVMDGVYAPKDYTSVVAPVYVSNTNRLMKFAIYDQSQMGLNYYAYLKSVQNDITLLLPSDAAMAYYYDPASMKSNNPRSINMTYRNAAALPIQARSYVYYGPYNVGGDFSKIGTTGNASTTAVSTDEIVSRLKDILESHTIVHDAANPIKGENEYYLSKNGCPVKIARDANGNITGAKGGFQLENERLGVTQATPGVTNCQITQSYEGMKNGQTYVLDAPLVPTYRSIWSILTDDLKDNIYNLKEYTDEAWTQNPYSAFYDLCNVNEDIILYSGLVDEKQATSSINLAMKKYRIFSNNKGSDNNVSFLNNYNYTIFVPTNEAIQREIANGLPTWEEIEADYNAHRKPMFENDGETLVRDGNGDIVYTNKLQTIEDSLRIQTKITYLINFVKYHFMDKSVFVDNSTLAEKDYVSNSFDKMNNTFCWLYVQRPSAGKLQVKDENGGKWMTALNEYNGKDVRNILARDYVCSKSPRNLSMSGITIDGSSSAVIHLIPGALNHAPLAGGRHDSAWSTPYSARNYLKRYGIVLQ